MPLINTSVPNLIQGVSQQPDATRFAGQCEEQENALSSVAEGLKKRPNTRHIGRLMTTAIDEDSFVHFINRSDSEKYVVIHNGTKLQAWNMLTGAEASINGSTGGYTPATGTYLYEAGARENLKALTVADTTLLLNTNHPVIAKTQKTPELVNEALLFVTQGGYEKEYTVEYGVNIDDGNVTTPATLSFNFTAYLYDNIGDEYFEWRHRLTSVTVTNAGVGYGTGQATVSLNVSSGTVITPASLTVTMDGSGGVASVAVNNPNGNIYRGTGQDWTEGSTYYGYTLDANNGNSNRGHKYHIEPAFAYDVRSSSATGNTDNATYTSGGNGSDSNANTNTICGGIKTELEGETLFSNNFTIARENGSNVLVITADSDVDEMSISTRDSLGDTGIKAVFEETSSISDLPLEAKNGFKVKIKGDAELNEDDYYVEFQTTKNLTFGAGSWVEAVGPSVSLGIDTSTMPHSFVSTGVDSFRLEEMKVADRFTGDDDSNPLPSFVSQNISNMFFFKNRLGFLSGDNVILSESGLGATVDGVPEYNFGRTTVTTLLDSDPIDVSVASSRVTNLKAAKGFQENLVLFSENGQFVLKGGDVLTPKTVSITPITNFSFEDQVDPLPLGSYIYFPFTRGAFTGLREFTINASTDVYDSLEVTEHVPAYIPKDIIDMSGTTSEDLIALLSANEKSSLYLYNYFWNNNQKVLSAWSKFTFTDEIRGIEFIDSTLYMVMADDQSNTHLVALPFESGLTDIDYNDAPADFLTLLDKRVRAKVTSGSNLIEFEQPDGTYSSANGDQPYVFAISNLLPEVFVDSDGVTHTLKTQNIGMGSQVLLTSGSASSTLYGYVGIPYNMKYKFSTQVFKASSGNSASPTNASAMQVRNGTMFFSDTHTFDVKVTPEHRSTATSTFSADDRPEADQLGAIKFAEGNFRFPVYSKAKHADIVIENDSPFDSKFSSAEFESFVHPRSKRYG